jgi:predicted metal-dependent phosphoesterase TrpH
LESTTLHLVLAADAAIDLQMHTTYSDGKWAPEQLMDYLVSEQFGLVAITDHDRVDTAVSLQHLARQKQLPVLVAAELSTTWRGEATDILCYGYDPQGKELRDLTQDVLHRQQEITQEVYANLLHKGYVFPRQQEMLKTCGGEPLQWNDLMRLIEEHGYGANKEAAKQIMSDAGHFFATNDIAAVVDAAHRCGGVCLIAHPGRGGYFTRYDISLLDQLRQEVPIDGLEAYYPAHTAEQTTMYLEYARQHRLLVSSGSDSHCPEHKPIKYRAELSRELLERVGINVG